MPYASFLQAITVTFEISMAEGSCRRQQPTVSVELLVATNGIVHIKLDTGLFWVGLGGKNG